MTDEDRGASERTRSLWRVADELHRTVERARYEAYDEEMYLLADRGVPASEVA